MGIEIARMLIFAVTIWFSTVEFFIKDSGKMALYQEIYSLALAVELLDITIKVAEIKCFSSAEETPSSLLFKFHMPVFCFLYLLVKLGDFEEKRQHVWVVLEITAMYFMHKRAGKIFESLRFYYFTLRYEYQAKIVDLILKIFIYTHFLVRLRLSVGPRHVPGQQGRPGQQLALQRERRPQPSAAGLFVLLLLHHDHHPDRRLRGPLPQKPDRGRSGHLRGDLR